MNPYEQAENKLTYSFLSLIEHLNPDVATLLFNQINLVDRGRSISELSIELLYGGGETNPDGKIQLLLDDSTILHIYFENKTWRRRLDMQQIQGHVKQFIKDQDHNNKLLVVTTCKSDRQELDKLKNPNISFASWHDLVNKLEALISQNKTELSDKDRFLINQFCEYCERSGEAWRAKMITENLIASYSTHLRLTKDVQTFHKEAWGLMEQIKDSLLPKLSSYITAGTVRQHWGRLGVECTLNRSPLDEWIFFGIYFDTNDHGIQFKRQDQPEYAVFFDFSPSNRSRLMQEQGINEALSELSDMGFELNLPENKCKNPWRICYWREPMTMYSKLEIIDLERRFHEMLKKFFESNFYKIIASLT